MCISSSADVSMTGESDKTKGTLEWWLAKLRATDFGDDGWVEAIEGLVSLGFDAVPDLVEALGDKQLSDVIQSA